MTANQNRFLSSSLSAVAAVFLATTASSHAATVTYNITAIGAEEVGPGDPDGLATGTLTLDNVLNSVTFNLTLSNIAFPLGGHHIHQAAFGVSGNIVLDFGSAETPRVGNTLAGTTSGLSNATINSVMANPTGFYYNLHNTAFGAGAVRDQLPEPGALAFLVLGAIGLSARRRR